jgi:hypothetical protein
MIREQDEISEEDDEEDDNGVTGGSPYLRQKDNF